MTELENLKKEWEAIFSCMGCGECGFAINPMVGIDLTCPVKEALGEKAFEIYFSRGRMSVLKSILEGSIPLSKRLAEYIYQCTECGSCTETCHQSDENVVLNISKWIDQCNVWNALRKDLVKAGFAPLERHTSLIEWMNNEEMKNPYGEKVSKKFEWLSAFPNIKEECDLVFFGGCTMPLRQENTLKNMMKILQVAGIEFAMTKDEWCCGSIGIRIGKNVEELIRHNIELIEKMGAKTVFTACAGCYRTLKKDYPELLGEKLPFEVKHITEVLIELLNNNQIPFKLEEGEKLKVTYHDPCHLGRHMGLYEIPREVIAKMPGVELIEMKRNRNHAWCCGAGGGVKSQFPELALDISKERLKEAIEAGANLLTTSCPFCIGNLNDAYNEMDPEIKGKIIVMDIIDLITSKL
ncbi:MAG: (Fe-S)-binding protein [Promethearchaeota archaeon]